MVNGTLKSKITITGGVKTPITMPKLRHKNKYNNNKQLTKGKND